MNIPKPNDILKGNFWAEPVRVLTVTPMGNRLKIEAVGVQNDQFYSKIFSESDLAIIQIAQEDGRDFSGNANGFSLATEAHRVRFAHQFDPLFAVNVSQVDPLPHQIEAVYHYLLRNPHIRFLLADDPGAGKTIMTGLLLKELKYRGLVQRALIVVPGHLKDQWLREMKERFSETFTVVDRSVMNATWGRNVWQEQAHVITSMDFAKQDDVQATLAETQWDLVIVDEAHKMAAYKYGDKTNKTERYRFGELISRISNYLLFLTATPHRGDTDNFRLFLDLLEPGMFADNDLLLESVRQQDNPLFLRRLKEDLKDFDQHPIFPPRHVNTRTYRLNDQEMRLYNEVTEYVRDSYNKALESEKRNVAFALLILQRRMASSVRAVLRSLERRKSRLESLLSLGQRLSQGAELDEDALEDAPEAERLKKEEELLEKLTASETKEELQEEIQIIADLIRLAKEAERNEIETKLGELRQVMETINLHQPDDKLLIFTESRETLEYLDEKLRGWGYSVVKLHGGMGLDARIQSEHEFREHAQVMVSTEAGGEGINLQFCSLMVNYDIPWNPNRLEQRMGRIHRYGQQKEVHIYNLVASDTREGAVLLTIFEKLESIQKALGSDRVFDIIGEVISGRSLKDLIVEAISMRRSLDDIVAEIKAIPDTKAVSMARQAAMEGLATRHIDLQRILGEDARAREQRLVPEYIERFFERCCEYLNLPLEKRRDGLWRLTNTPYELRTVSQSFKNQYGEVFREYSKLAFDKEVARREGAVFVAPGHPLLESIIERIFATCGEDLKRGAVFYDPDGRLDGWLWFLEGELRDGANQIAGKRLFAIYQPKDADTPRVVNSSVLWDLKSAGGDGAAESCPDENRILEFAVETILDPYLEEILQLRLHDAKIKEKYGVRSLERKILESDAKITEYATRKAKGETIPDVDITNEERRKEDDSNRKQNLEREIRQEISLSHSSPKIHGVVRVIPQTLPHNVTMRSDKEIEAVGMRMAIEREREEGREPEDVSLQNLGYDIRSVAEDDTIRYIEVKARAGTGSIAITPNEWMMAQRLGDGYWLYVVENAAAEPELNTIQNPAAKLHPEEVNAIARYVVKNWKEG
ncbi:MAG: DUF3883 domain-containing protein [Armatimonadetes bacterium]|nr:DUF3883 domain-containing protein [Armatimonadota bacterium]